MHYINNADQLTTGPGYTSHLPNQRKTGYPYFIERVNQGEGGNVRFGINAGPRKRPCMS
ncbi:MAG: hypothetical protein JWP37_2309 [Mucilaginibacter sp.]|nr:hypothetical protein [Mucilaginibacter sp.]